MPRTTFSAEGFSGRVTERRRKPKKVTEGFSPRTKVIDQMERAVGRNKWVSAEFGISSRDDYYDLEEALSGLAECELQGRIVTISRTVEDSLAEVWSYAAGAVSATFISATFAGVRGTPKLGSNFRMGPSEGGLIHVYPTANESVKENRQLAQQMHGEFQRKLQKAAQEFIRNELKGPDNFAELESVEMALGSFGYFLNDVFLK